MAGRLIYSGIASLDGYVVDEHGNFDWAAPDEQVHAFVNERERAVGCYLFGRRMYEVMVFWETAHEQPDLPAVERDYAQLWQAADKIVYSSTLTEVGSARTRIEPRFDPEAVRRLKADVTADLSIGGADLAAQALRAGVVDEVAIYLTPVVVGGGTPLLPAGLRIDLELMEERRFDSGFVHLRYRIGDAGRRR
jgi:dihydrofolate reductase